MKAKPSFIHLVCIQFVLFGGIFFVIAQDKPKKILSLEIILGMNRSDSEEKRSALFNKYAVAVDRLQKAFQDKGDLTNAVKAKKEAEIARKSSLIGKEDIPGFNRIREILREEIAKIDRMELSRTVQARKNNIKQLRTRVTELTKEGKLGGSTQDRCRAEGSGNVFGRRHQAFGKSRHQKA